MIKYGAPYIQITFPLHILNAVRRAIANTKLDWQESTIVVDKNNTHDGVKDKSMRSSQQVWLRDYKLNFELMKLVRRINRDAKWFLNVNDVEPVQFGMYPEGGFYDWHVDQHPHFVNSPQGPMVRKISMSLFMNEPDEYEGGEFDLETFKPGTEPRYQTFRLKKGEAIFFSSTQWHRVRPVTSGIRKSIVCWFTGPPYV